LLKCLVEPLPGAGREAKQVAGQLKRPQPQPRPDRPATPGQLNPRSVNPLRAAVD